MATHPTAQAITTDTAAAPAWPHPSGELPILPAFAQAGHWYYRFPEGELPVGRAFAARAYYEEMEMRCTREHLLAYCAAQRAALNQGDLVQAAHLTAELQDRLDWIFLPEAVYKLAAVVYFDPQEDPYGFDFKLAGAKIARWRAVETDFFCARPVRSLLPGFSFSDSDLQAYLRGISLQALAQAAALAQVLQDPTSATGYRPESNETVRSWLAAQAEALRSSTRSDG